MATPCVPTLGSQTFLTDVGQIMAYVFRAYILLPRSRSDIYTDEIISYMDDVSEISYDKTVFSRKVEDALNDAYARIFNGNSTITVTTSCAVNNIDSTRYELVCTITATDTASNKVYEMAPTVLNTDGIITIENDTVFVDDVAQ